MAAASPVPSQRYAIEFFFNLIEGGKEARSWLGIVEDDKASRRVPRRNGHWPVEKREGIGSG